jgi:DNA topoisomerase-1
VPPRKKPTTEDNAAPVKKGRAKKAATTAVAKPSTRAKAKTPPAGEEAPKTPRGKKGNLVIVESPAKAKTIEKYLGAGFTVRASYGHVRDLPAGRRIKGEEVVGVNIQAGWVPRYLVQDRREGKGRRTPREILDELQKEANKAATVYLATDPDREGEAIAWHISEELGLKDPTTFRITFNEITKSAVQRALANPSKVNIDRVKAQEARRVLDRVVGYPLSGLLGKKVTRGLSAGRVQSVAVKLIVDREREIEQFVTEEYWKITAWLSPQGTVKFTMDPRNAKVFAKKRGADLAARNQEASATDDDNPEKAPEAEGAKGLPAGAFSAELAQWQGGEFKALNEAQADAVYAALNGANYIVSKVEQTDRSEKAKPPFTTSNMQQQASIRLRMSGRTTMMVAQKLYEGVNLGSEGQVALITYMRTDSTRISADAMNMVRNYISTNYGPNYLPAKPNSYASGKSAQEAHEAIRPTDLTYTPQMVRPFVSDEEFKLYKLIYEQFVSSQMSPAIFAITNVEVEAGQGLFKAQGRIEKFDGYRRVLAPAGKQEDTTLPSLVEKQHLDKLQLTASQHFTQPPPRFNEASLVKMLEKKGIGRPSTYVTIISTIQKRGYVVQDQRRFRATEIGKVVNDLLVNHFPEVVNVEFTSHIEEELDEIETGVKQYADVLNEFWAPFSADLKKAETDMPAKKGVEIGENCPKCGRPLVEQYSRQTGGKFIGCAGWRDKEKPCTYKRTLEGEEIQGPVETEFKCPACGKNMMQMKGRFGVYLRCSGAPECKTTMNIGEDGKPIITAVATQHKCEKCGGLMVLREWKGKKFLGCSNYPKCRNSMDADDKGQPVKPVDTGVTCDKCGQPMRIRSGFRGPFLSCSGYPKCKTYKPLTPELKEKLKDQLPPPPAKKTTPEIPVSETCPECDSPMKVRVARGKPFLGCSKYPKCKGTREAPPAVVEQLQKQAQADQVA